MTKNDHQGGPRIAKNAKKMDFGNLKNQKMAPQKGSLRDRFFSKFWVAKKIGKKGGQGRQRDEKHHRTFVNSTKFWGPGPPLSIKDTKKTKKDWEQGT